MTDLFEHLSQHGIPEWCIDWSTPDVQISRFRHAREVWNHVDTNQLIDDINKKMTENTVEIPIWTKDFALNWNDVQIHRNKR